MKRNKTVSYSIKHFGNRLGYVVFWAGLLLLFTSPIALGQVTQVLHQPVTSAWQNQPIQIRASLLDQEYLQQVETVEVWFRTSPEAPFESIDLIPSFSNFQATIPAR